MIKNIKIKKELSDEEFKEIILKCEEDFIEKNDLTSAAVRCEKAAKEITPATDAALLIVKPAEGVLHAVTQNLDIPLNPRHENILMECYNTKQSLMINDATRSFLYREKIDNFLGIELKDLLLIPVIDDSAERNVLAILWTAIRKGSWNQYTQKDLDYMTRFAMLTKRFLLDEHPATIDDVAELNMEACAKACDQLRTKIKREQEYFASIIHDIRTPMNAVMGFLELLNLIETDQEKKDYLDTAIRSGESMVTLINDALDIAKMASGQMRMEKRPFDPLRELDDVAKLFHNTSRTKGVFFTVYVDPELPKTIVSDPHRIKQIMNNLLSNAVKFTPKGGEVSLEMHYKKESDGLTISVRDSGPGIAPERQKEIFTPFVQETESTARKYGGTGLGLSISQQLAVLLGGRLQLESAPGKGSRFHFTIPCNTEPGTPSSIDTKAYRNLPVKIYSPKMPEYLLNTVQKYLEHSGMTLKLLDREKDLKLHKKEETPLLVVSKEASMENRELIQEIIDSGTALLVVGDTFLNIGCQFRGRVERIGTPLLPHELFDKLSILLDNNRPEHREADPVQKIESFPDKHVMIVDDNVINLKFMKEVLKRFDLRVTLAQSGEESIEKLRTSKIDLIFMDENMPEMQGTEVIRAIREEESKNGKTLTIVGLTGDADEKTKETILNAGADEVLTKPVKLQEIIDVATRYLASKSIEKVME